MDSQYAAADTVPKILIVDDEISSLKVLSAAIEDLGTVLTTSSPSEAIQIAQEQQPLVALLDIEMGEMSGLELCRQFKDSPLTANIAIIFVTSHTDPNIEYSSLEFGGIDFLTKPVDFKICRLRVQNQLALRQYSSALEVAREALYHEKELLKVTLNSIGDAVIATDTAQRVTFMNPIAERMTGWSIRDARGQHIETVMELRDATSLARSISPIALALQEERIVAMALNSQLVSQDGTIYRVEDSAAPIRNAQNTIIGAIIVFHDVSEAVAMAVKMSHLANHDQLTDLPNRILLHDRISQALKACQQNGDLTAVLLIDIDNFKYLNDSLGHTQGDLLIKQVAKRLAPHVSSSSTLARIGGDEFVLVTPKIEGFGHIDTLANDIVNCVRKPFLLADKEYPITISVGISVYPTDSIDEASLMRNADVAMYRAKQQGRNGYCFFSKRLESDLLKRHQLEQLIRQTIEKNTIEVFFQPQLDLSNNKIIASEALARMKDNNNNYVSPLEFIPLAEELGLINELGIQILRKSCLAARKWQTQGLDIRVCVNISAKQFAAPDFINEVSTILDETCLHSSLLELEVTESALMHDYHEVKNILDELSLMGVSIAIDDFGTGYSSLSYLKLLTVDVLKIDQSFVRDMLSDEQSLNIVKTIIYLASALDLTIIAEGIENEKDEAMLKKLGCHIGQGYLFSKPVPEEQFEKLIF